MQPVQLGDGMSAERVHVPLCHARGVEVETGRDGKAPVVESPEAEKQQVGCRDGRDRVEREAADGPATLRSRGARDPPDAQGDPEQRRTDERVHQREREEARDRRDDRLQDAVDAARVPRVHERGAGRGDGGAHGGGDHDDAQPPAIGARRRRSRDPRRPRGLSD